MTTPSTPPATRGGSVQPRGYTGRGTTAPAGPRESTGSTGDTTSGGSAR